MVLVSPSKLDEKILKGPFSSMFNQQSVTNSEHLFNIFKKMANEFDCKYLDLNSVAKLSDIDGLHYDKNAHIHIAKSLELFIKTF